LTTSASGEGGTSASCGEWSLQSPAGRSLPRGQSRRSTPKHNPRNLATGRL